MCLSLLECHDPADGVSWEVLYCVVELLLCMGLQKDLFETGCFVAPLLFSLTTVYGLKPDLFLIIFYILFAYFLTTSMSIYAKSPQIMSLLELDFSLYWVAAQSNLER